MKIKLLALLRIQSIPIESPATYPPVHPNALPRVPEMKSTSSCTPNYDASPAP